MGYFFFSFVPIWNNHQKTCIIYPTGSNIQINIEQSHEPNQFIFVVLYSLYGKKQLACKSCRPSAVRANAAIENARPKHCAKPYKTNIINKSLGVITIVLSQSCWPFLSMQRQLV